jgi:hypothetical protein
LVVNLPIPIAAENKVEAERQAVELYKKEEDTWLGPRLVKLDRAQVALTPRTDAFATVRGKIYPCLSMFARWLLFYLIREMKIVFSQMRPGQ